MVKFSFKLTEVETIDSIVSVLPSDSYTVTVTVGASPAGSAIPNFLCGSESRGICDAGFAGLYSRKIGQFLRKFWPFLGHF